MIKKKKASENIWETAIPGLLIIERPTHTDGRGFFREVIRLNEIEKTTGVKFNFKQWNHAKSKPRVIRALHSENQNKIVYPITGSFLSVYVDIRPESSTFGKALKVVFKEPHNRAVYIPRGVANSVCVLGEIEVHYLYLIDEYHDSETAKGVAWDDADLNIDWPIKNPIISDRDRNNPTMRELFPDKYK